MGKWFINSKNIIKGPFTAEEVKNQLNNNTEQMQLTFLWSRGHSDWIRADKWNSEISFNSPTQTAPLQNLTKNVEKIETRTSVLEVLEDIKNHSIEKWRVQYDFVDKGEMTKEELTTFTAKQDDVGKISIFDKKDREWRDIYSLPDVVQRLGLTRRENQRVPILAQFTGFLVGSQAQVNSRVITISHGGLGLTDNFELKLGETIQGQLTSPHFFTPLTLTAEVTYAGLDGYVGLKFIDLNAEMQTLVMDYIKRFGKDVDS